MTDTSKRPDVSATPIAAANSAGSGVDQSTDSESTNSGSHQAAPDVDAGSSKSVGSDGGIMPMLSKMISDSKKRFGKRGAKGSTSGGGIASSMTSLLGGKSSKKEDWIGLKLSGGRYKILDKLGEGGMGFVYKAYDQNLDTDIVIKAPRRALMEDEEFARRFDLEIRSLVKLTHPNIVKVIDVGKHDGIPFAVMQCLSGGSIEDRITGENNVPVCIDPETVVSWMFPVANALDFIHGQGYVHRDIKPGNVLFDEHQNVFLSDFGVAKVMADQADKSQDKAMTGTGLVMGTPDYLAPELVLGQPFDGRADQYSLAIMVHELISGQIPFNGPTPAAVMVEHSTRPAPSLKATVPSVSDAFAKVVLCALSKDPNERYATCMDFCSAMADACKENATWQPPTPPASPPAQPSGSQSTGVGSAANESVASANVGSGATSNDPIIHTCPNCSTQLAIPREAASKRLRCRQCQTEIVLSKGLSSATQAPAIPDSEPGQSSRSGATVAARSGPFEVDSIDISDADGSVSKSRRRKKKGALASLLPFVLALAVIGGVGYVFMTPNDGGRDVKEAEKKKDEKQSPGNSGKSEFKTNKEGDSSSPSSSTNLVLLPKDFQASLDKSKNELGSIENKLLTQKKKTQDVIDQMNYSSPSELNSQLDRATSRMKSDLQTEISQQEKAIGDLEKQVAKATKDLQSIRDQDEQTVAPEAIEKEDKVQSNARKQVASVKARLKKARTNTNAIDLKNQDAAKKESKVLTDLAQAEKQWSISPFENEELIKRSRSYLTKSRDTDLKKLALLGLTQSSQAKDTDLVWNSLNDRRMVSGDDKSKLLWLLAHNNNQATSDKAISTLSNTKSHLDDVIDNAWPSYAKSIKSNPKRWKNSYKRLSQVLQEWEKLKVIVEAQCRVQESAMLEDLAYMFTKREFVKDYAIQQIVSSEWKEAYPHVGTLAKVRTNRKPSGDLNSLTKEQWQKVYDQDKNAGRSLMERMAILGTPPQVKWALEVGSKHKLFSSLTEELLQLNTAEDRRRITRLFNSVLSHNSPESIELAINILQSKVVFTKIEDIKIPAALQKSPNRSLSAQLCRKLCNSSDPKHVSWVMDQVLGTKIKNEFVAIATIMKERETEFSGVKHAHFGRGRDGFTGFSKKAVKLDRESSKDRISQLQKAVNDQIEKVSQKNRDCVPVRLKSWMRRYFEMTLAADANFTSFTTFVKNSDQTRDNRIRVNDQKMEQFIKMKTTIQDNVNQMNSAKNAIPWFSK